MGRRWTRNIRNWRRGSNVSSGRSKVRRWRRVNCKVRRWRRRRIWGGGTGRAGGCIKMGAGITREGGERCRRPVSNGHQESVYI